MAATRGDGSTDVPVSVAELCRRLGSAPATTDSVSSSAAPVLVGDLLRREGRPPVRAEVPAARVAPSPEPEPDEDQPVVPTPRSRGDACRTALGAGGLVVAGSVLGAALLAAAGVGGPLPFGQGGDDAAGQFQGEGTLVKPGTAYGSVRGRDVVARSGAAPGHRLLHAVRVDDRRGDRGGRPRGGLGAGRRSGRAGSGPRPGRCCDGGRPGRRHRHSCGQRGDASGRRPVPLRPPAVTAVVDRRARVRCRHGRDPGRRPRRHGRRTRPEARLR